MRPISEDAILALLATHFENAHPRFLLGRGDDCALIRGGGDLCFSTDLFIENAHFRRAYFSAADVGHKALAVNISDLAAVGAKPLGFTLSLGLPPWVDMLWLDEFFISMAALAGKHRMMLAGGDLSKADALHISITVFGECQDGCAFLGRGGSMPGDALFIVGQIGLARLGLHELEKNGLAAIKSWPQACKAHLRPEPQVGAGLILARLGHNARPPALMDLSDGILRDLPRLLGKNGELGAPAPNLGVRLKLRPASLPAELMAHAAQYGENPLHEALIGGEDYALLGSCAADLLPLLQRAISGFQHIGDIIAEDGIWLDDENLANIRGFDHFEEDQ